MTNELAWHITQTEGVILMAAVWISLCMPSTSSLDRVVRALERIADRLERKP